MWRGRQIQLLWEQPPQKKVSYAGQLWVTNLSEKVTGSYKWAKTLTKEADKQEEIISVLTSPILIMYVEFNKIPLHTLLVWPLNTFSKLKFALLQVLFISAVYCQRHKRIERSSDTEHISWRSMFTSMSNITPW